MKIILIAAHDLKMGIGKENKLPWKMPTDLKHFKSNTLNKVLVWGRTTFETLPVALSSRTHWVLSNNGRVDGADLVFNSAESLISEAKERGLDEIWIAGGQKVYELFLPYVTHMVLTEIQATLDADRHFPAWERRAFKLEKIERPNRSVQDEYDCVITSWKRVS